MGARYLFREIGIGLLLGTLYGTLIGIYTVFAYGESETLLSQPFFKHMAISRRCLAACAHDWHQHLYEHGNVRVRRCYDTATLQSLKYRSSSYDRTDRDDDGGCIGDADVFSLEAALILGT